LWFPVWNSRNGHLYFRSKTDGIKIHYDDGLKAFNKWVFDYVNLYTSFQAQKNFKNAVIKAGSNLIAKNWSFDTRVRVEFPEIGETDVSLGHKFSWAQNNWSFDTYDVFSFKQNAILNNAIRVGYRQGDN